MFTPLGSSLEFIPGRHLVICSVIICQIFFFFHDFHIFDEYKSFTLYNFPQFWLIWYHTHTHTHTHTHIHMIWLIVHSWKWKGKCLSHVRLFATPWTMDYIVHGILHARILEWVAFPNCRVIILVHSVIETNFDHFPLDLSAGKNYFLFLTSYIVICVHILFLIKYLLTSFRILWRKPAPLPINDPKLIILSEDMCTHTLNCKFICNF